MSADELWEMLPDLSGLPFAGGGDPPAAPRGWDWPEMPKWEWPEMPDWEWPELPEFPWTAKPPPKVAPGTPPGPPPERQPECPSGRNVAGDPTSKDLVRVAWTIDDGPSPTGTPAMKEALAGIPATWYVQRSRVEANPDGYRELLEAQKCGSEIAIHNPHPENEHADWFPASENAPGIEVMLAHCADFVGRLRANGIKVDFVRLPYGLATELYRFMTGRGFQGDKNAGWLVARAKTEDEVHRFGRPGIDAFWAKVKYEHGLAQLGLEEWGGPPGQSWMAESSPDPKLTDDVTGKHGDNDPDMNDKGKFEQKCDRALATGEPQALVVLAHDAGQGKQGPRHPDDRNAEKNAAEVGNDIGRMDEYAAEVGVRVEFCTMGDLMTATDGQLRR
jgi:peptidoglycan/xylan/chitin deacetylase (PgdA/CDA1 family)